MDYRDKGYILEIIEYCDGIIKARERFGDSIEIFSDDADYRDSVCMKIFQIGEIANQISEALKEDFPDIPWDKMYGIRNIIAHAYIQVNDEIIWDTLIKDIPVLKAKLEEII